MVRKIKDFLSFIIKVLEENLIELLKEKLVVGILVLFVIFFLSGTLYL